MLSLVGDVLLMVPADLFVPGLAAFLAAHVAYVVALWMLGVSGAACSSVSAVVVVGGAAGGAAHRGRGRPPPTRPSSHPSPPTWP